MSDDLLARKPWEPTERKTIRKRRPLQYRWETDAEMDDRHAAERAEHDAQWGGK